MTKRRPKQTASDTSSLKSIDDIAKKYSKKIDLQKKVLEQSEMIGALNETIDILTQELTRIKVDKKVTGDIKVYDEMPDSDKLIAETQLSRLKQAALGRDLTLEETRKFEIFSKVKNSNTEKKPKDNSTLPRDVTPRKLMAIASGSVKKSDE